MENNEKNNSGKMSLARALKEKERIVRRLTKARVLFAECNSHSPDVKPRADAKESYEEVMALQRRYLAVKKAIADANTGISAQLTEMLIVRAEIEFYKRLNCQEEELKVERTRQADGEYTERTVRIVYNTYIKEAERRRIVEELEDRLDDLQDEVDAFNATHTVVIPD